MDLTSPKTRLRLVLLVGLILCGAIVVYFLLVPQYKKLIIRNTPFLSSSFSTIQGKSIYSYSGLSFYKTGVDSIGTPTILSSGVHFPAIKNMYWAGDDGVFLVFGDTGLTGNTLLETTVSSLKETPSNTAGQMWYFDFSSQTLHLVQKFKPIVDQNYFDTSSHVFYYVAYDESTGDTDAPMTIILSAYSTKTLSSTVVNPNIGSGAISHIGKCPMLCFIQQTIGDTKVALWETDGTKKTRLSSDYTQILPTASSSIFIGLKEDSTTKNTSEDALVEATGDYINTTQHATTHLPGKVTVSGSLFANTVPDDSFYIIEPAGGSSDNLSVLNGAKNVFKQYRTTTQLVGSESDALQAPGVIKPVSRNDQGQLLYYDVNEVGHLLSPGSNTYHSNRLTKQSVETAIGNCFSRYTSYHEYADELHQFKIGIVYDANFEKNVTDFAHCVTKTNPTVYIGNSFIVVGLSPVDGRFVTN